jgi:hypothetical protein
VCVEVVLSTRRRRAFTHNHNGRYVAIKQQELRGSLACSARCRGDLEFLASGFGGAAEQLQRRLERADLALDRDSVAADPATGKFLRALATTFNGFWRSVAAAAKACADKLAAADVAAEEVLRKVSRAVEQKCVRVVALAAERQSTVRRFGRGEEVMVAVVAARTKTRMTMTMTSD